MEDFLIAQFDISFIDVSAYVGLTAAGIMTLNLFIGLLLSVHYNTELQWPHRRLPLLELHKWSGYSALFVSLLHPAWLPLAKAANYTILAVFFPFITLEQPILTSLGALAAYTLIFVVVTAYLRNRFKYTSWKKLHYASYVVIGSFLVHGIFTEPSLKHGAVIDYLDGGKLFIEACALVCVGLVIWRVTYGTKLRAFNAAQQPEAPSWRGELVIHSIIDLRDDVKMFRLVNPRGGDLPFAFLPGQSLRFRLKQDDSVFTRSYSICSAPDSKSFCDIAVKRASDGKGSAYLYSMTQVGQVLTCDGPHGTFTFSGAGSDGVVLIAGGIGLTPLLSIVRHLANQKWPHDVFLLFAVSTPAHGLFEEELHLLAERYRHFHYLILPSRIDGSAWPGPSGRLQSSHLVELAPQIALLPVYLCGPEPMMSATISSLRSLGVEEAQIHTESFGGTIIHDDALRAATIFFAKSNKTGLVTAGRTLLDAAEEYGVPIESLCRTGVCGTCKVQLISGEVKMHTDTSLTARDIRNNLVLACQARPATSKIEIAC